MHKIFANTLFIGKQFVSLPSCHSTNDIALQMAAQNLLYDGAVIYTEAQTKGRGQRGNSWQSEAGKNLTFSLFLLPKFLAAFQQFELNRIISVAITDVLGILLSSKDVYIKWPNDIYIDQKKVAGILIENTLGGNNLTKSIIGVGLNVNQKHELPPGASAMITAAGHSFDILHVLELLAESIEKYFLALKRNSTANIHQNYLDRLYLKGTQSSYRDKDGDFEGVIQTVEADGTLVILDNNIQIRKYQFKEVQFL